MSGASLKTSWIRVTEDLSEFQTWKRRTIILKDTVIMLNPKMKSIEDEAGKGVPESLPTVIDAHVHVFPESIFQSIWDWFDTYAWPIRYRMSTEELFGFLLSHGIKHIIALQYAHRPGIAQMLNQYMVEQCNKFPGQITGMATVLPGEPDAVSVIQNAFDSGLGGLKLHLHVQCFDMNSKAAYEIYECCLNNGRPIVIHAGREPKSEAYRCDPYQICSAANIEQILIDFPDLKICVPHLGFDEVDPYRLMIEKYDNLWLDTTMVITDYFSIQEDGVDLKKYRSDRIMYGSDFPNIPYAWDRELKVLERSELTKNALVRICNKNAMEFFNIHEI